TGAPSQAMHRSALLATAQAQILATLPGQKLDEVTTDGWSVFIVVGDKQIHFIPREVHYEEADPIRDVDQIDLEIANEQGPTTSSIGRTLGRIERVCLVRTLTAYLPPEAIPAHDIMVDGRVVKVPAGKGHRRVNVAPSGLNAVLAEAADGRELHFMPV